MSDPTPTPAAPDWRELCSIAIELWDADCDMESVVSQMRAALVTIPPDAPPDDARIESLRTALREVIDACGGLATADVSDEFLCLAPGEVRSQLAKARRGTPPAPTREALAHDDVLILAAIIRNIRPWVQAPEPLAEAILSHPSWSKLLPPAAPTSEAAPVPVPGQGAEISDDEWNALRARLWDQYETVGHQGERFMWPGDFDTALDLARQELARYGHPTLAPVAQHKLVGLTDEELWQIWNTVDAAIPTILRAAIAADRARYGRPTVAPVPTPEPAADQQEGRDDTDGRDPVCVAQWPDCEDGAYDPRCCRFPKSCSCGPRLPAADAGEVQ